MTTYVVIVLRGPQNFVDAIRDGFGKSKASFREFRVSKKGFGFGYFGQQVDHRRVAVRGEVGPSAMRQGSRRGITSGEGKGG